jgi:putative phosphonate transport system ATP-binding protein
VLGVVGESGSGKSTLLRCLCFDEEATAGGAYLSGYEEGRAEVFSAPPHARRRIRNEMIGTVHQNPLLGLRMGYSSLANVAEKLIAAGSRRVEAMRGRSAGLLTHVRIPGDRLLEPPATFSGGMQQRVQIAKALAGQPVLLLLDEVTAGLDVSVQARVLDLLRALREELTAAMIFVSHDLRVVRMLADRTLVMRSGLVVEQGLTDQILEDPQHPCTQELVHAML